MRVTTRLKQPSGDLESELMAEDLAIRKLAFRNTLGARARALEKDFEAGLRAAGLPAVAPLMASAVYPNRPGVGSFNAQSVVYVKAGPTYQKVVQAALDGATIRAHGGKYLAIPTNFNLPQGRFASLASGGAPEVKVTPRAMIESGAAFLVKRKRGPGFIWMLRVAAQQTRGRGGQRIKAVVSPSLARDLRFGTSSRARAEGLARTGAVPLYTLVPQILLQARLNTRALIENQFNQIEPAYAAEYRRLTRG